MKHNLLLLSLLTAVIFSCKKKIENLSCETVVNKNYTYDTVQPSDYLMTYPGSWWKYSDGTTDSCTAWKNVSIAQVFVNGNCKTILEDMHVLPHSNHHGYISFESEVRSYADLQQTEFIPLISETPGVIYDFKKIWDSGSGYNTIKVTSYGKLDSMTIGTTVFYDVIHMRRKSTTYYYHVNGGPFYETEYYYVKGIGVIRKLKWHNMAGIPQDTTDLIDHYIAPH